MKDVIIIGAGPAGLGAAVYAKRAGLNCLLIEESPIDGGQVLSTYEVDNYLGLPGISGIDLGTKFSEHAKSAGVERTEATVLSIKPVDKHYMVHTDSGDFETAHVVVATGAKHANLNVPGEEELSGMGVSYCATCDGAFFKNKEVAVVGGSDVAVEDAIYLARTCKKVYLIHRRDTLRAADSLVKALENCENVVFLWNSEVLAINGEDMVESVTIVNNKTRESQKIVLSGVFIAVGINPTTSVLEMLGVEMDEKGYVIAGEDCRTGVAGVYVAGDIRKKPMRQIITAVCDGANAIASIQDDMNNK
ncbi:MAG: FAD-dependent oxidoreductase [Lachnospiraceae bacterium]|nr:FAD-dependent oxidoreductase [Lachnospiraceae bacterium]